MRLDPRTKLFMVFVVSLIVMMSATTPVLWVIRIIITLIPIVLLILEKKYSSALTPENFVMSVILSAGLITPLIVAFSYTHR